MNHPLTERPGNQAGTLRRDDLHRLPAAVTAVSLLCTLASHGLRAADDASGQMIPGGDAPSMSVLDGKSFTGELGHLGQPALTKDVFVFEDGLFTSKECERRCGYTKGAYWMRLAGDRVQFKAETPCLKSDATIVWTGVVEDDRVEGTFTWTSRRWYWTIEKVFWFKGRLTEAGRLGAE